MTYMLCSFFIPKDNATGTIANSGQCMTERGGKVVMSSNKSDCAQFDVNFSQTSFWDF